MCPGEVRLAKEAAEHGHPKGESWTTSCPCWTRQMLALGRLLMYSLSRHKGDTMQATIVDLRYHMNQVLKALERNETVSVLYRGKLKGVLSPATTTSAVKVTEHSFFGCRKHAQSVEEVMEHLRGGRHRGL